MRVAQLNAKGPRRVNSGVHASQDKVLLRRRQDQVAHVEVAGVARRGGFDVLLNLRHADRAALVVSGCGVVLYYA